MCDFVRGALELHGGLHHLDDWPSGRRDIHAVLGISRTHFWGRIDETDGFWESLAPFPQPWNSLHAIPDRMNYLAAELSKCHAEEV